MQVGISRIWHIIVNDNVDTFNVNSPTDQIGSHKDPLMSFLEVLVSGQPSKAKLLELKLKAEKDLR